MDTNQDAHLLWPQVGEQPKDPLWREVMQNLEAACQAVEEHHEPQRSGEAAHTGRENGHVMAV